MSQISIVIYNCLLSVPRSPRFHHLFRFLEPLVVPTSTRILSRRWPCDNLTPVLSSSPAVIYPKFTQAEPRCTMRTVTILVRFPLFP
jgi:hypothetical protein